jgi:hypothetical protein
MEGIGSSYPSRAVHKSLTCLMERLTEHHAPSLPEPPDTCSERQEAPSAFEEPALPALPPSRYCRADSYELVLPNQAASVEVDATKTDEASTSRYQFDSPSITFESHDKSYRRSPTPTNFPCIANAAQAMSQSAETRCAPTGSTGGADSEAERSAKAEALSGWPSGASGGSHHAPASVSGASWMAQQSHVHVLKKAQRHPSATASSSHEQAEAPSPQGRFRPHIHPARQSTSHSHDVCFCNRICSAACL